MQFRRGHGLDEIGQVMFQVTGVRTAGRRLDAEFDVTHFDLEGTYGISQGRYGLPQTTSSGSLQHPGHRDCGGVP